MPDSLRKFDWWNLFPASDLLISQPGDEKFDNFVSLVKLVNNKVILGYLPSKLSIEIRKPLSGSYTLSWFDPMKNTYSDGRAEDNGSVLKVTSPSETDMVLILNLIPQVD